MKKIIISMDDPNAIEVLENNRLTPRYGNPLSFQSVLKEKEVAQKCEKILEDRSLPRLIQKLNEFSAFAEDKQEELQDIFAVLEKTIGLQKQGFRILIILSIMRCARGQKSQLGYGCFDEKFAITATDLDCRKDLLGTKYLLPIEVAEALLIDLMNYVSPDDLDEGNIRKSELVKYYLSSFPEEAEQKLNEFIKFCQA